MTVALWFHGLAVVAAILPLSFGYPNPAVAPTFKEWGLLLAINSFVNQIALNRGFQLELAVRASAVNYTQVCLQSSLLDILAVTPEKTPTYAESSPVTARFESGNYGQCCSC